MSGIIEQFTLMMTQSTGFSQLTGGMVIMWAICVVLFYLAIVKGFEPLLLLPITFGAMLANIPTEGVLNAPTVDGLITVPGGLYYYISQGIYLELFPPIIFMGVGALTDFGPLIANPRTLLLGAAAQIGVFVTMFVAVMSGVFTPGEGASIGIIGGADGPTSIFTANKLAPHLIGPIAVAAYTYMSLVPLIQPPIMKFLTTDAERKIRMKTLRPVGKLERIIFAVVVMVAVCLVVPPASALIAMMMLGNIMRESGVVERLTKSAQNEIINMTTIFLGTSVGLTMGAENFLQPKTLMIIVIGVIAFGVSTAGGVLLAKLMNKLSPGNPLNPLIGSAGVSAVPMAARVSQVVGAQFDKQNFLLMHAMGPNVAGVIGTAVCAGYFISRLG
jgi:carboxybiotin decarboxylase